MKLVVVLFIFWFITKTTSCLKYPILRLTRNHRGTSPQGTNIVDHILKLQDYENGYLTNNGYFYYPHHEYHSYGLPTYLGEYKPKTYYYSSGPSYNYYSEGQPVSNPLDDLHEEILQENEQERQTKDGYDDDYFVDPTENINGKTRIFLRNMIENNNQKENQERFKTIHNQQKEQFEHQMTYDDYPSETEVNPDDYQFELKGEDNFDLQKYWDDEFVSMNKGAKLNDLRYHKVPENKLNYDQSAEEFKLLSKIEPKTNDEDSTTKFRNKGKQSFLNNLTQSKTSDSSFALHQKEYDYSDIAYDDGSWINWDRKRNSLKKRNHVLTTNRANHDLVNPRKSLYSLKNKKNKNLLTNEPSDSKLKTTFTLPSISYRKKEKHPMEGKNLAQVFDKRKDKQLTKSAIRIEHSIYDTIKQIISIEQDLNTVRIFVKYFINQNETLLFGG